MDTVSATSFQPVQPDGYVLRSPRKEAPRIEITETDALCHSQLSSAGDDVALSEWDDYNNRSDATPQGDFWADQSPQQSEQEACDARGGSRRSEGRPGKCPSPSRSSPRRHSPVPYSPKRQHRSRNSGSSVASDDFSDASFSPRRHSPVPFLSHQRPFSLPLVASTSEEFICVSYSDPFSSPTIAHASEGILAISISCSQEAESENDVEMRPSQVDGVNQDGSSDIIESGSNCSSADEGCVEDCAALMKTAFVPVSVQREECRSRNDENSENASGTLSQPKSVEDSVNKFADAISQNSATYCQGDALNEELRRAPASSDTDCTCDDQSFLVPDATECMEGEGCFLADFSSSDSSSDDDMEDILSAEPQLGGFDLLPRDLRFSGPSCPFEEETVNVDLDRCHSQDRRFAPNQCLSRTATDAVSPVKVMKSPDSEVESPININDVQQNKNSSTSIPISSAQFLERAACYSPRIDLSPEQNPSCSSRQSSPEKMAVHGVADSPDDFSLSRVIGSPPLHFPHCQNVVLLHCALANPYDLVLPTPPIVLTPHTSYQDVQDDDEDRDSDAWSLVSPQGGQTERQDCAPKPPDISRSRSFPRLNLQDNDRFHEPHQDVPVLGDSPLCDSSAGERLGTRETHFAESQQDFCSAPGASWDSRAAVIGLLRRVVERRLSGSVDSSEAALQDG